MLGLFDLDSLQVTSTLTQKRIQKGRWALNSLVISRYKLAWNQPDALTSMMNYYRYFIAKTIADPVSSIWSVPNDQKFIKQAANGKDKVEVPTLIIWGTKDIYLDEKLGEVSVLPEICAQCTLKKVPTASHWILADEPDIVNKYIQEFIKE